MILYQYIGLSMLLEILILRVYSMVISHKWISSVAPGSIYREQERCDIITESPKEKEYGYNVALKE